MRFIGIGHYKRVGKDLLADMIVQECARVGARAEKLPFAKRLKDICHQLYGWAGLRHPEYYDRDENATEREVVLPEIGKSPRQIWIDFGTKAVREQVYDRTWVDCLLRGFWCDCTDLVVIPDVRFPNEAEAIRERGGHLIKVVRKGFAPGDDPADRALLGYDGWDMVIGGISGREELLTNAAMIAMAVSISGSIPPQSVASRSANLEVERRAISAKAAVVPKVEGLYPVEA